MCRSFRQYAPTAAAIKAESNAFLATTQKNDVHPDTTLPRAAIVSQVENRAICPLGIRTAAVLETEQEVREVYRQLESDLTTLFKLVFTYRKPVTEGDIRIASVILRKWLIDGLLGRFCNATGIEATIPALDNSASLTALPKHPAIDYFLTAGVRFNGIPVSGIYNSAYLFQGAPKIPSDQI